IGMLNLVCLHVMIKNIGVKAYPALPRHGRGIRVDAHLLELAHVAPELESADLEEIAEEHAALKPVLEAQPQLVVFFRLACCYSHRIELLEHVAPPREYLLRIPNSYSQLNAPPVW